MPAARFAAASPPHSSRGSSLALGLCPPPLVNVHSIDCYNSSDSLRSDPLDCKTTPPMILFLLHLLLAVFTTWYLIFTVPIVFIIAASTSVLTVIKAKTRLKLRFTCRSFTLISLGHIALFYFLKADFRSMKIAYESALVSYAWHAALLLTPVLFALASILPLPKTEN